MHEKNKVYFQQKTHVNVNMHLVLFDILIGCLDINI